IAIAILPATVCLGATLPAIGEAVAAGSVGRRGGLLYALNTAGGALGIAAMGFGLPAAIGVTASYVVAAGASALAGIVALLVGDGTAAMSAPPATAQAPGRLRIVAAGAGALGLGLEVLWIRLFAQVLHNSVYSFAAVTLVLLVALALGAALAAVLLGRAAPTTVAGGALLAAVATTIGGVWLFVRITDGLRYVGMETGLPEYLLRIVGLAAASAGPGAVASGAVLPALWAAFGDRTAARPLGDLAAANTFGGVTGALGATFLVLPLLGLRGGFLLAAAAYLVLADVTVGPVRSPVRTLGYLALLGVVALDPVRAPLTHLADGESLRALAEGPAGIVTVVDTRDDLQLRLDNYYVLGGSAAATNERRQGLLPLLLHPAPRRVAFIGMATGITASAGPALGVERTTVVELVPQVVTAASAYFGAWNAALLRRPDVDVVVDDGRRWLAAGGDGYDVIIADLFIPWHAGAGTLYARETFESARRRLAPGGLFCQWLPLYQLTHEEFDAIARTFRTVFPDVTVWRNDFYPDRPAVGIVGRLAPAAVDFDRVGERLAGLPDWSRDPLLALPQGLAMLYVGDLRAAGDVIADGPLNTDDRPLIEFLAPRLTRMSAAGDKDWFTGDALAAFTETVAERDASAATLPSTPEVRAARRAGAALFRYALAARSGDTAGADRNEATVRELVPDVVALGERTSPVATLADTHRTLDTLRAEQQRVARELDAMEQRLGRLTGGDE
ncbi:MAG TPA: fused MFS/spermidine synthase, partial [Candidatus Binatia bacterium]|nr:fused MFS/spermidine synthase [Candidatus Binatia bacterium]